MRIFVAISLALIIGGLVYISWPTGHIPPYDANLTRLAETELQGYCAGKAFWESGGAGGGGGRASACRSELKKRYSSKSNLLVVQEAFCRAIVDMGWEGKLRDCLNIMTDQQYWPTYDGNITNAWNRARPYPRPIISGAAGSGDSSRTGSHQGENRGGTPSTHLP